MLVHPCHSHTPGCPPPLTMSATNLKSHINLFLNPVSLLVSTFNNLSRPPPVLFQFSSLLVSANALVSLVYSWWKPQYWMKAPYISHFLRPISATVMSIDVNQVGVALFPSFQHFLSFYLSRFFFYINISKQEHYLDWHISVRLKCLVYYMPTNLCVSIITLINIKGKLGKVNW